jgi:phosphoribosylformylglycinamidine cyclo-ligase
MGVGMMAVVPQESVDVALTTLADRGVDAWVAGSIVERTDAGHTGAELTGTYAS